LAVEATPFLSSGWRVHCWSSCTIAPVAHTRV
jgi:hypothetical protein